MRACPATTGITIQPPVYRRMKWYIPLIIAGSCLLLFAVFGEPGAPALTYGTETALAETDPANLTVTYTITLTVTNTGTATADNTVVSVYLTTPPSAPDWQQTDLIFPVGRIAAGETITRTDTADLRVGKETYAMLVNETTPATTVVGTYSDAFF
ncbi:CARDB domain-containing protein [Methanogenium sp. MK-MG]|uniref:CARDB domain-containing protein n=1 Tax=Methanogenium sp. MK-MG TaxID=2599926 RepID=UPI0013EB796B|nr:CARDB domain-containing protein [Methanogenium sp. MK-MG]KAF1078668.1 hypothetical protein MKMG_00421 [Methanogenium sp. MK-MG]